MREGSSRATIGFAAGAVGIVALAAVLRFWGLGVGLPHLMARPDDEAILAATAGPARGNFEIGWIVYPSGWIYLNWAWGTAMLRLGALLGLWPPASYADVLAQAAHRLLLLERVLTALLGTAAVAATIALARAAWGRGAALAAGTLLATSFLHARDAHSIKPDVGLSLCVVAVLAVCLLLERRATIGRGVLAGLGIGAAMSCKYPGVLVALPVWVASVLGTSSRGWRRLLPAPVLFAAAATAFVVFAATSPYVVFTRHGVGGMASIVAVVFPKLAAPFTTAGPPTPAPTGPRPLALGYHLCVSLPVALGWPATLALPLAVAWALLARPCLGVSAALFLLGWIAVVGASPVPMVRYVVPVLPVAALLLGGALAAATSRLASRRRHLALAAVVIALTAEPLAATIAHDRLAARTDTRVLATDWLAAHVAPGTRVAITGTVFWGWGQPQMPPGVHGEFVPTPTAAALAETQAEYLLAHDHVLFSSQVDEAAIAALAPRLRLVAEFDPFVGPRDRAHFEAGDAYYLPLRGFAVLQRPGPRVRIWKIEPPALARDEPSNP